jgi:hypothetical protein
MSGVQPPVDAAPLDPSAPESATAAPAIPPSAASAPGLVVPPAPGQEGQTFGAAAPVDPAAPTVTPVVPDQTGTGVYRPRRPAQRQLQVRDQVMRNLSPPN